MATKVVTRKEGFWDKFYLPALAIGLKVTIKQFYKTLFKGQATTIQYPEVRRNYSQRFRGMHFISVDENKTENCTACYLCQTVCPAECITIVAEERNPEENPYGVRKEKKPKSFDIDALRCCFCGMCEEACPKDAIKLSRNYELATTSRSEAFYDLNHLKREVKGRG
jgi:NADH-quinone oxidoreductase subunit I